MESPLKKLDHSAFKVNQAFIIGLSILAFILNLPWIALAVTLAIAIGTALKMPGFGFVYTSLLKPRGWVKPDVITDNPEPHRFAQGFGAVVMAAAVTGLFAGATTVGWVLVWVVIALAALNLFGGFCAGCAVYYWLNQLHVPGFAKPPPKGVFPGMRPNEIDS